MKVDFTVNGKAVSVDVPPDMPLLWVLRETLHMPGTKFGCGVGQCGACTVHIAGKATKSCQVHAQAAAGAKVVTIEGLSPSGQHPLQQAWRDLDVPDCGYCQGGQIMAAAALLATTPNPTDAQIDAAMNGNLCRCGTYLRIRQGIHRAAQVNNPASKGRLSPESERLEQAV
jgi:isoquinoline 1-oxidoreductase alpha subunit